MEMNLRMKNKSKSVESVRKFNDATVKTRRKTISDRNVTDEILDRIIMHIYSVLEDVNDIHQKDLVEILLPLNLSNKTIAKICNMLVPNAKATTGSIASLIRYIKGYTKEDNELINELLDKI